MGACDGTTNEHSTNDIPVVSGGRGDSWVYLVAEGAMMFERKWEKQSEGMKEYLAYGMCTARRVTVSAAYLYQLEQTEALLVEAAVTREDAELLTNEIQRLERAKAEAERDLMYAERNRRRAEKKASAAVAERNALQTQVAELKALVRTMRESMAPADGAVQAAPLRWAVAYEKPSRWDFLEIGGR